MSRQIESVVILGGGTAGWITAAYLQKVFGSTLTITLREAPTIPRIGVGEATVPCSGCCSIVSRSRRPIGCANATARSRPPSSS